LATALATASPEPPPPSLDEILQQFDAQVTASQQVAAQVPENPNAWIELGNALYDSVVVVRERVGAGDPAVQAAYIARLPPWLEAADAYRTALDLKPDDAVIRADLAISLCYYGEDANDPSTVAAGLAEVEQAFAAAPEEPRIRLGYGICLAFSEPTRTAEAIEQWQYLLEMDNVPQGLQLQARQWLLTYAGIQP
jgi:cytochrome c-type biogenesis protein CcmH/NrfG